MNSLEERFYCNFAETFVKIVQDELGHSDRGGRGWSDRGLKRVVSHDACPLLGLEPSSATERVWPRGVTYPMTQFPLLQNGVGIAVPNSRVVVKISQ